MVLYLFSKVSPFDSRILRETVKAGFFCDFSSLSRCGKDWGVGTTPPCGHPSRGGEFSLVGLRGEFMLDGLE